MNKNSKTTITFLVLTGLLLVTFPLWAQEKPETKAPMPRMAEGTPELTDDQLQQIQNLRIKHLKEVLPLETELKIKRLELQALWDEEKLDSKAIVAKVKEMNELRNKLELARVNHRLEIAQLLTPKQRRHMHHMFRMEMGHRMGIGKGRKMMQRMME